MSAPAPTPPYSVGALEMAGVSFLGAFAGALISAGVFVGITTVSLEGAAVTGIVAFAAALGYHAYQSS